MFGSIDRELFMLAVVVYGLSTIYSLFLWRKGFRRDDRVIYLLLLLGLILHTTSMAMRGFSFSRCPVTNLYEATIFSSWAVGTTYLAVGSMRRLRFLGAFGAPVLFCMGVFALMPRLDQHGPQPQFSGGLSSLHASLSLLAYGAFGLGSIAAAMYLVQERDLKLHRFRAVLAMLPSIERLEVVTSRLLVAGLVLLSIGILNGMVWLKREKGVFIAADAKILWSYFVWLVYLGLLVVHWRRAEGGRRFAWGAIGTFCFVILTFWGTNLLSEIHNPLHNP